MTSKYLIFDFDGTLVQSLPVIFDIVNRLAKEIGFKQIDKTEVEIFRKQGSREVIKSLGISIYKFPKIMTEIRKGLEANIENTLPVSGIESALKKLTAKGFTLGILTSNSQSSVQKLLDKHNWNYFDFIYSGSSLFGKGKVIKKMMKDKMLTNDQLIYIGDETRDIEAAKECRIKVAAVTWGYNSGQPLAIHNPTWLLHDPKELLNL